MAKASRFASPSHFDALHRVQSVSADDSDEVLLSAAGSSRVVTLNRPRALNALNLPMVRRISQAVLVSSPTTLLRQALRSVACAWERATHRALPRHTHRWKPLFARAWRRNGIRSRRCSAS